tara:strand:- start:276 stop:656 length:381 start_codon:yes stop_codon:yes gene_type:complete
MDDENKMNDIDSITTVRRAGVRMTTGLMMLFTDDELRFGTVDSRHLHEHRKKHHGDEHLVPIVFPAGKPLNTMKEIIEYRSKVFGVYMLDNWVFKNFKHAYRYALGQRAWTKQGYIIQNGKHPSRT